ncbi:ABC transporter substrate-binding protein [Kineococcus sp. NUM-3379]
MAWRRTPGALAPSVVLALAAVTACSGPAGEGPAAGGSSAPAGPLRVVGQFEVHSIDPATAGGFFTRLQVAETLVDADTTGQLVPGLATAWEVSGDQLTWTFPLREGATFHDGTPVRAEDVVAALETARRKTGTPLDDAPVASVAADGGAVRITLTEPFSPLPAVLTHTGTQILAPASYAPDGSVTEVVGTGPYEVEEVTPPSAIDVVASDDWKGERPAIERVAYQTAGRAESRALMAESGQADVTLGMDPVSLQRLRGKPGLEVVSVTLPRTIQFKVDAGHEFLGDVRVRRALSLALDREGMATALLRDPEMAATQLLPPTVQAWHSDSLEPLEHDPAAAKALLAEAGWTPGPDGVLTRDGRRFEVALRTFPDRPELPPLATAIQDAFRQVGVALDVQVGNSSEIPAGHQDGTLQMGLFARNYGLTPEPLVSLLGDFGPEGSDWGAMRWSSPELTASLRDVADGIDEAGARAARERVVGILHEELPVVPVAWYRQSAVVGGRVEGVELDPLERSWRLTEMRWS